MPTNSDLINELGRCKEEIYAVSEKMATMYGILSARADNVNALLKEIESESNEDEACYRTESLAAVAPRMLAALKEGNRLYSTGGLAAVSSVCGMWINEVRDVIDAATD